MSFCPSCGTARVSGATFCGSCGLAFDQAPAQPVEIPTGMDQSLARGNLAIQNFALKLIVGRVIGLVAALGIWYAMLGTLEAIDLILALALFFVFGFVGLFAGERIALLLLAR